LGAKSAKIDLHCQQVREKIITFTLNLEIKSDLCSHNLMLFKSDKSDLLFTKIHNTIWEMVWSL